MAYQHHPPDKILVNDDNGFCNYHNKTLSITLTCVCGTSSLLKRIMFISLFCLNADAKLQDTVSAQPHSNACF